jgi:seryl-tRNA synthetase
LDAEEFVKQVVSEIASTNHTHGSQLNEKELLKKLWIAEKSLREITSKFVALKAKYERNKAELRELRKGQETAEASLKSEIKFLITKLNKTKIKLAQNVELSSDSVLKQLPSNLSKNPTAGYSETKTTFTGDEFYQADKYYPFHNRRKVAGTCRLQESDGARSPMVDAMGNRRENV